MLYIQCYTYPNVLYKLPGALVVDGAGVVVGATYGGALKDKERFVGGAWRKKNHC